MVAPRVAPTPTYPHFPSSPVPKPPPPSPPPPLPSFPSFVSPSCLGGQGCPCFLVGFTSSLASTSNENVSPSILNRLIKEVQEYTKNPVSDIRLQVNEENVTDIRAELIGPGESH
eukprot:766797-Hanusia_phi.AAC.2